MVEVIPAVLPPQKLIRTEWFHGDCLADYYHVPIEKTIAVGDSLNDLPMLTAAGLGLAVKNADAALKEQVRTFPYTNDENAVGRIIAEYGFLGEDK